MPRRLKVATTEMGPLELFVIYAYSGEWEPPWRAISALPVVHLLTTLTKEQFDAALIGWTKPLVTALRISPEGALRKIGLSENRCFQRANCPFFDKKSCSPQSKKMPWCFEPEVSEDPEARRLTAEVIGYWREGVYVAVVFDEVEP